MRLIHDTKALNKTFETLLDEHDSFSFSVAWATTRFPVYEALVRNAGKIKRGTVGIHFWQTDPEFVAHFLMDKRVKFAKSTTGVFHPKVYLFESSRGEWACIVGSANFTSGAFGRNEEVCLLVDNVDGANAAAKGDIDAVLDRHWEMSGYFSVEELERYRVAYERFAPQRRRIAGEFDSGRAGRPALDIPLLNMSWNDYVGQVQQDKNHDILKRLRVLDEARRLFRKKGNFETFDPLERKGVAGFWEEAEVPWRWFGSMQGAGMFMNIVNDHPEHLGDALRRIPFKGPVTKDHYLSYIDGYRAAFKDGKHHGLATATRLLAMKRPDYFVCLDSKNTAGLCEEFGKTVHHHDYEAYWDSVIERVLSAAWWNSPRPSAARAGGIWDGRVAFLDSLYFDPD